MSVTIKVDNLGCSYGAQKVLSDVTFGIKRGSFVGIIGPNGSGKSTLLKHLSAALKPVTGQVLLNGKDICLLKSRDVAIKMAVVPQDTIISFGFSALEVVLMGRHPHLRRFQNEGNRDMEIARQAMEVTGTRHLQARNIMELSGGERQRVIVARALTQEPEILILDEPTAHLDIHHQLDVLEVVNQLNKEKGVTVIAVLHDLNLAAQFCDRLILLRKGNIFALGKPEEVITSENIRDVYQTEVLISRHPVKQVPQVTLLSKTELPKKPDNQLNIHVICGGGTGCVLMDLLVRKGHLVTAGVLNIGDNDWQGAKSLGLEIVEEAPFSPISDRSYENNKKLIVRSNIVILTGVPFGFGNIRNLQILEFVLERKTPVYAVVENSFDDKDYTGGYAVKLFEKLKTKGLQVIDHQNNVLKVLEQVESLKKLDITG
ncbi:heme ABC transporter ATP-binding protein [Desulfolucanica intricata]|uniref:heme ABC transporter ATP-binding protein n=1 Tax=Desulfolucanica intricata TaxID=1285191 RepID=UPI00082F8B95|nr:heme ABC transporter ATP-binding protein [Desulfolucanica intricata]